MRSSGSSMGSRLVSTSLFSGILGICRRVWRLRRTWYKAALLKQRSDSSPGDRELRDEADVMIAKAKYFASNASFEAADRTVQILGSSGYSFETRAPRHLVDTRVCRIYEGTDEIMVQKIAVSLLGTEYEAYR